MIKPENSLPLTARKEIAELGHKICSDLFSRLLKYKKQIRKVTVNDQEVLHLFTIYISELVLKHCELMEGSFGPLNGWTKHDFLNGLKLGIEASWKMHEKEKAKGKNEPI